jgi:ribosomal protein S26
MKKIQQAISKDALVEYKNWIKKAGDLEHRFFSFSNDMKESYIEQIYLEPKSFVAINGAIDHRFVVIRSLQNRRKHMPICVRRNRQGQGFLSSLSNY